MLRSPSSEGMGGSQDSGDRFGGRKSRTGFCNRDHVFFSPLLVLYIHRFGDAVSECDHEIADLKSDCALRIERLSQQSNHRSTNVQAHHSPFRTRFSQYQRRVVTSVDVSELFAIGIVLGVEECGVPVFRGHFVEQAIDPAHECCQAVPGDTRLRAKRSLQTSHHERSPDPFS